MGKLHLKRTPAEEAERAARKARKRAKKEKASRRRREALSPSPSRQSQDHPQSNGFVFDFDDDTYGPPPPPSSYKIDEDAVRAEIEGRRFQEKMSLAFEDDEQLHLRDEHMNSYAHIPYRWRDRDMEDGPGGIGSMGSDPRTMDDEEYAEWMREGMWRKKHAKEFEEQKRKDAARAEKLKREREAQAETDRLLQAEAEERRRKKSHRRLQQEHAFREEYECRWASLLHKDQTEPTKLLSFSDVPWPIFPSFPSSKSKEEPVPITVEHLTPGAIAAFILPQLDDGSASSQERDKKRKDVLRDAMLRFHPDKFEGRVLRQVVEADQERVREAVGIVVRAVRGLMEDS